MSGGSDPGPAPIAREGDLSDGQGIRFQIGRGIRRVDGILVRFKGRHYAYVNLCRHMPMPLDLVPNRIFSANKRFIRCQNHGAMYDPTSGKCLMGPCKGKSLVPIAIEVRDGAIFCAED